MNAITVGCLCPDNRHPDGDTVTFRETLDFRTMAVMQKSISWLKTENPDVTVPETLALLTELYLLHCIESWTVRDSKGKPVPVSPATVREFVLPHPQAFDLADFADGLYTEAVLLPLVQRVSKSSPTTPTSESTSATPPTGKSRKPSKPSSTSTTPTAATALTLQ